MFHPFTHMPSKTEVQTSLRYEEIAGDLQQQIVSGEFQPRDRLPSVRMLRREYGVTQATVERALAILEKERLITRSARSGVFVAPPESKARTGLLGFCGVSFTKSEFSPYWTHLIEGVESAAREHESQIVLLSESSAAGWDKVDGILANALGIRIPADFVSDSLPILSFFAPMRFLGPSRQCKELSEKTSAIVIDETAAMRDATEHLISLGHRRIAYLNNSVADEILYPMRLAGYESALRAAGITPSPQWLRGVEDPSPRLFFMNWARDNMRKWLREDWHSLGCTAILGHNDDAAWGIVEALREYGIDVPGEVSVMGYDGTEVAQCSDPELTTVDVPLQEMGRQGVALLERMVKGNAQAQQIVLQTRLHIGASTARAAS